MNDALPAGWITATLEEIAEINPRHPKGLNDSLPVTFASMPALSETSYKFQFTEERALGNVKKGYTHFAEGDVLFAKITPCMENGKAAVATGLKNGLGCGTTEIHVLRPYNNIDSKLIYHFLHQDFFRREAVRNFTGTAGQLRVPVSFIKETEFPLPPLNEQKRIVEKLEKLLSKVDACQKRLEKIPILLKRFRQSILSAACSGKLTENWRENKISEDELPKSWQRKKLSDVCISFDYGTSSKSQKQGKIPVLRMGNLQNGEIDWSDLVFTSGDQEIKKYALQPNTVLFNRTNSPELVGKTSIYRGERLAIFAGYLIRIRHSDLLNPEYLNYCLNTFEFKEFRLQQKTDGVSQSNINAKKLASYEMPFCDLEEQQEIVRRVKKLFALADQLESRYNKAKAHVDKLTQSILAKAFRGDLVPQDPNDEPASELLKRIKSKNPKKQKLEGSLTT